MNSQQGIVSEFIVFFSLNQILVDNYLFNTFL